MELMQRLGSDLTPEYINNYIEQIKKHKGSCDNVWIATPYGYPSMEYHRKNSKVLLDAAEKFRSSGISVSLQLSNSIGHGEYMSGRDCSGLVYDGSPVENMVDFDGTVARYCFCWRGEFFKKYLLDEIRTYMMIKPDTLWVDDDFRPSHHSPAKFGCFCDGCIKKFNKQHSSDFDRDSLVNEILHGDIKWRKNWIEFVKDGLASLMTDICLTVKEASPDTSIGYQHGVTSSYVGYGNAYLYDAIYKATNKPPKSRPGGGAYDDHDPNEILLKTRMINIQNSCLPSYVECICPEIENLPFVAYGKSAAGTAFETAANFANGSTDMSYSMLMHMTEPMSWHEEEFALLAAQREYYEKLSKLNKKTHQSGIRMFVSHNFAYRTLAEEDDLTILNRFKYDGADLLARDAIPYTYFENDNGAIFLHPEIARVMSEDEIAFLFEHNVITDGETIKILTDRGYDMGVRSVEIEQSDILKISETLLSHPINPDGFKAWTSSFFTKGKKEAYYLTDLSSDAQIVSIYSSSRIKEPFTNDSGAPFGVSGAVMDSPKGKKWVVFGYSPWKGIISLNKRDQILNAADFISGNSLPARLITPHNAVLLPRKDSGGNTACVSLINCTIGDEKNMKLLIRNPKGESFVYMSQYNETQILKPEWEGKDCYVTVPELKAWSVGTVFCE